MQDSQDNIWRDFSSLNAYVHDLGFEVIIDCNPHVLKQLGVSFQDLSFFKEIGADGIVSTRVSPGLRSR